MIIEDLTILHDGLWYLAHPYTVLNSDQTNNLEKEKENYINSCKIAAQLIRMGIKVYSPISHTHPIHKYGGFKGINYNIWLPLDMAVAKACKGIILCKGWEDSVGCKLDRAQFEKDKKYIIHVQTIFEFQKNWDKKLDPDAIKVAEAQAETEIMQQEVEAEEEARREDFEAEMQYYEGSEYE